MCSRATRGFMCRMYLVLMPTSSCMQTSLSGNSLFSYRSRTRTFSSSSFSSTQPLMVRQNSSVFTPGSANHQQFVFPFPSPPSAKMSTSSSSSTADCKSTAHHPNTSVPLAHSVAPIGHDYINSKGMVYMEDVHNFALQIACGLQHLASMEVYIQSIMYKCACG